MFTYILSLLITGNVMVINPSQILLDKWQPVIDQIEMCESNMRADAFNPKDTDGLPKYGCMQFDVPTAKQFINKYGIWNENWDGDTDMINWLYDCQFSRRLAARMMEDGYINRWGCAKKIK